MENERPEIFKLDQIDRKVLFWLMDREPIHVIQGWIEYVASEYKKRNIAYIDVKRLLAEVVEATTKKS
jgi:hypothetical protein